MGCTFTREAARQLEEPAIKTAESLLGFEMIDCGEFDMSFSRFCTDSHLTEKQLISSMESLGIDKNTLEDFPFDMYLR